MHKTLREIGRLDAIIESKLEELHSLRETGGRIAELAREIDADVDRLVDAKRAAMAGIDRLEDAAQARLMYMRYMERRTWEEVAEGLGCSRQWAMELHRRACLKLTRDGG